MGRFYHVTSCNNLDSIKEHGLVPQYGFLSDMMLEQMPAVYLFKDMEEVVYAMNNWLKYVTYVYSEKNLILLQVDLPEDFKLKERYEWEALSYDVIPWKYISVISFPDLKREKEVST